MKFALSTSILLMSAMTVVGCASLTPPQRPDYRGVDNVTIAQPDQLVGIWRVKELNPIPGTGTQNTTIEYRSDGSVVGNTRLEGEELAAFGPMDFVLTGQWQLNGDTVIHENITMESKNDAGISSMISNLINNQKGISGQANIYELSADRIVMMGDEGAAMEYIRQ